MFARARPIFIAALLAVSSAIPSVAAPDEPLTCDTMQIFANKCHRPAEIGGIYPHCFCSVATGVAFSPRLKNPCTCPDGASFMGHTGSGACLCFFPDSSAGDSSSAQQR